MSLKLRDMKRDKKIAVTSNKRSKDPAALICVLALLIKKIYVKLHVINHEFRLECMF